MYNIDINNQEKYDRDCHSLSKYLLSAQQVTGIDKCPWNFCFHEPDRKGNKQGQPASDGDQWKETYSNEVEETEKMLVQLMSELEGRKPPKSRY